MRRSGSGCRVQGSGFWFVVLVTLAAVAVAGPSWAQVAPVVPTSMPRVEFDAAIRQALEKNPTMAQAAVAVTRAEALLQQAKSYALPSLSAGITNTTLDSERGFSGGVTQPRNQFAFTASGRYNTAGLFGLSQARDAIAVATASSVEAKQGIAIAAADAYLAIIASRRQVEVVTRSLDASRAHLSYADRRLEGGAGSRLNQLRAQQEVTGDELRLENARLSLRRAQEALGVVLVAEGPVDAGAEPAFDVPQVLDESSLTVNRPDLVTQTAIQRAAERVVRESWLEWAPFPTFSFDPSLVTPSGLFQPSKTWRFTVAVTQPLFDGGERRAAKRVREASLESAKLTFSATAIRARSEVRIARDALASLDRALAIARTSVTQAADVLRITTSAFEVGATTNIEVIDAQRSARDAETSVAVAEDAVRHGRLDLLIALGRFPR
jgi:outer membrane protein TolC